MRTLILYSDDFSKFSTYEQICNALNVDSSFDKLILTVSEVEESTQAEEDEEEN